MIDHITYNQKTFELLKSGKLDHIGLIRKRVILNRLLDNKEKFLAGDKE